MNRRRKGVAGIKAKQAKQDVLKAEGEKIQNEEFAHMEAQASFWFRIPTVKLKIPGKAFLKSETRTSVTFKL